MGSTEKGVWTWNVNPAGANKPVRSIAMWGNNLVIGGDFETVGNANADHIAIMDNGTWRSLYEGGVAVASMSPDALSVSTYALAIGPSGFLYAGGRFDEAGGKVVSNLAFCKPMSLFAGLTPRWLDVGGGVDGTIRAIAVDGLGAVYVGGEFEVVGNGVHVGNIAVWRADLGWQALDGGVNGPVYAIAIDGDRVFVGGQFDKISSIGSASNIACFDPRKGKWYDLDYGLRDSANSAEPAAVFSLSVRKGILYVGGNFTRSNSHQHQGNAKWDPVQKRWHQWVTDIDGIVRCIAFSGSGIGFLGGNFNHVPSNTANLVATGGDLTSVDVDGGTDWGIYALAVQGKTLYAGGDFDDVGPRANRLGACHVAAVDVRGTTYAWRNLHPQGNGVCSPRPTTVAAGNGKIYVGGDFNSAGTVGAMSGIAEWDALQGGWRKLGDGLGHSVNSIAVDGPNVYAGGNFNRKIKMWDGVNWTPVGGGLLGEGAIYAVAVGPGGLLYVGGTFNEIGSGPNKVQAKNLAVWDGVVWNEVAGGVNGAVYSVVIDADGMYVGGTFTDVGPYSHTAGNIAFLRFSDLTWLNLGDGLNVDQTDRRGPAVLSLCVWKGGVVAAGRFTRAGATFADGLAHWRWDKHLWAGFPGTQRWADFPARFLLGSSPGQVYSVVSDSIGSGIYVGGNFDTISGEWTGASSGRWPGPGTWVGALAHWNGSDWSETDFAINEDVRALVLDDHMLYLVGGFTKVRENTTRLWKPANKFAILVIE